MRIGVIVPGGVDRSGEQRVIPTLLSYLQRLSREHKVRVFALQQHQERGEWWLAGVHITNIGSRNTRRNCVAAIWRAHRSEPFDLLQAFWSGTPGLLTVTAAKLIARPCVVHVAGGELTALRDIGYGGAQRWTSRVREWCVLHAASAVTAASAPMIEALARCSIDAHRIPLGADRLTWPPRRPSTRNAGSAQLVHIASLNRVKDQVTLLLALAQLKLARIDFRMNIIGEDTLGGEIQALARALHLQPHVVFHGFKPHAQLRPWVEAAHLLVMSSRHESGPLVLLEAAMVGVPTVGTAVGHIAEWAPDAAVAVPPADSNALAHAIARLLIDEPLRMRLAQRAHERALKEDADDTARRFIRLYAELTPPPKCAMRSEHGG